MREFSYNEERKEKHKVLLNQGFLKKNWGKQKWMKSPKNGNGKRQYYGKVKTISRLLPAP